MSVSIQPFGFSFKLAFYIPLLHRVLCNGHLFMCLSPLVRMAPKGSKLSSSPSTEFHAVQILNSYLWKECVNWLPGYR